MRMRFSLLFVLCTGTAVALSACTQTSRLSGDLAPAGSSISQPSQPSQPSQTTQLSSARVQASIGALDIQAFLASSAFDLMNDKDRVEATSAQYNILQFGRPGAPRNWNGPTGNSGKITVGPYVRVNTLDCREFNHTVKISDQVFRKTGTACRKQDGKWEVEVAS